MAKINILFFGPARSAVDADRLELEFPDDATVADVKARLKEHLPPLAAILDACRFAVNQRFANDESTIVEGDEIAVIPPVSGGAGDDRIELTGAAIDVADVRRFVVSGGDEPFGGVCVFEGRTRDESDIKRGRLLRLEYEAYGEMAIDQMWSIAQQARQRWPIVRLAMVHRTGAVAIGEPSIVIAVSSGHRAEAFESCRWMIDTLKRDVPIWKREIWESGESNWVDPTASESP